MDHVAEFIPGGRGRCSASARRRGALVRCDDRRPTLFPFLPSLLPAPLPGAGVKGMQLSNPGVLQTVALRGSLEVFAMTSMEKMRAKSLLLTGAATGGDGAGARAWWRLSHGPV